MSKVIDNTNKDIHIHLDNGIIPSSITGSAGAMEKYVMWQNQQLSNDLTQITLERNQLLAEKEELAKENTRYGSSGRYTKSLLRNLVELHSSSEELAGKYKMLYENNLKRIGSIKDRTSFALKVSTKTSVTCVGFMWKYNMSMSLILFFILLSVMSYFIDMWINDFYVKFSVMDNSTWLRITKIENDTKKIKDSQDFLDEYIENLN